MPVAIEHFGCHPVDVIGIGEVGTVNISVAANDLDLAPDLLELLLGSGH